ncbi:hypothetical protein MPSEU_000851400 [Mayamaea pseudoterrestris]|nr:hypothetical protein MPSEU_000851400 [Mayamaea pseudoterrestris]
MICLRRSALRIMLLLGIWSSMFAVADETTPAPTPNIHSIPPHSIHPTADPPNVAPPPGNHNATEAPFSLSTVSPSQAPSRHHHHHKNHSHVPTSASPTKAPSSKQYTTAPTPVLPPVPPPQNELSFLRILAKTLAWCILLVLSVLLFGAIMSHRYRIYFFCRGLWLVFIRMQCTQTILLRLSQCTEWVKSKMPWRSSRGGGGGAGLNTILFSSNEDDAGRYYNEMREGLLHGSDLE